MSVVLKGGSGIVRNRHQVTSRGAVGASAAGPGPVSRARGAARGCAADAIQSVTCLLTVGRDRKSTRLNSSHVAISYAVFCLKNKNNKILFRDYIPVQCVPV